MSDAVRELESDGLYLRQKPRKPIARLRLHRPSPRDLEALGEAIGYTLSADAAHAEDGGPAALWLAPGEWWLVGFQDYPALEEKLAGAAAAHEILSHVSDLSDAIAAFTVSGANARALIAKGCSLDLHERVFPVGRCARTLMSQLRIVVHKRSAAPSFDLHVDAALASYFMKWCTDAAAEFLTENRLAAT